MIRFSALGACFLLLSACARQDVAVNDFWLRMSGLCGQAFEGQMVSNDDADAFFESQRLVMLVRDCSETEIHIPFSVGTDDTRTWVLSRGEEGVLLRHYHRHLPNRPEGVTDYGGALAKGATGSRLEFPVDAATVSVFEDEGLIESMTNVWAMEMRPSQDMFAYEMARPGRFFRIEFDTSEPVPLNPTGETG